MNNQTPGPFDISGAPDARSAAQTLYNLALRPENARLFAAAYSTFDKAGRELGVDAAELAKSIDLAALIRALKSAKQGLDLGFAFDDGDVFGVHSNDMGDTLSVIEGLIATLPPQLRD